jgi:hypothetical protein
MKKILLGGTALAVAAMAAAPASADVAVTIHGFVGAQAALVLDSNGQNGDRDRDYDFLNKSRLQFDIKNVTDSGLEYGARIRFENVDRKNGIQVNRTYVYVKGGFGTFTFGDQPGVGADMAYVFAHDAAISNMGLAGGFADNVDGLYAYGGGDFFSLDPSYHTVGNDTRVKYTSPSFGGLSFAVDFAPVIGNGTSHVGNAGPADLTNDANTIWENSVAGGLYYSSDFDGLSVIGSGTATYGNGVSGHYDLETYSLGGQLGSGGLTGSIDWINTSKGFAGGQTDKAFNSLTGSLSYVVGAFEFGLGYSYTWAEKNNNLAGSLSSSGFDLKDNHIVSGTVVYNLAPGLNTFGEVTWEQQNFRKRDAGGVAVVDSNSADNTILMTGLHVSF